MEIIRLHAFSDNYIWLLRQGDHVVAVDPGEARPVIDYLESSDARLSAILLTHHHLDHRGGVAELAQRHPTLVYGPAAEEIPDVTHPLIGGEHIELPFLPTGAFSLHVLDVAGHTRGHLAYFGATTDGADYRRNFLFCGDTLFTLGCGRLFEGSAEQMYQALQTLSALPTDTLIYCAHEYTRHNLPFALTVEPHNPALLRRAEKLRHLLANQQATVPMVLMDELDTNPFLRCHLPTIITAVSKYAHRQLSTAVETFSLLRKWRDDFKIPD